MSEKKEELWREAEHAFEELATGALRERERQAALMSILAYANHVARMAVYATGIKGRAFDAQREDMQQAALLKLFRVLDNESVGHAKKIVELPADARAGYVFVILKNAAYDYWRSAQTGPRTTSLDAPIGGEVGGSELHNWIEDSRSERPDADALDREAEEQLRAAIDAFERYHTETNPLREDARETLARYIASLRRMVFAGSDYETELRRCVDATKKGREAEQKNWSRSRGRIKKWCQENHEEQPGAALLMRVVERLKALRDI